MISKGKKCLGPEGHVNEIEVSRLVSPTSHIGFFMFSKYIFLGYVLYHLMEISTLVSQGF